MFRPAFAVGLVLTAFWLVLVWLYVDNQVGWTNLFFLLPTEIAMFFAAAAVPPAFLWLVVAFLWLAERNRLNRQTLSDLARDLADASPKALEDARGLTAEIEKQIEALKAAGDVASRTKGDIAGLVAANAEQMTKASERTADDTERMRETYEQYAENLAKLANETAQRLRNAMESSISGKLAAELKAAVSNLESQTGKLTGAAKNFSARIQEVEGELDDHRVVLAEATARATAQAGEIRSAFSAHAQELTKAADHAAGKLDQVHKTLETQVAMLETMSGDLTQRVTGLEQMIDRQAETLQTASSRAVERATALEQSIGTQLAELSSTSQRAEDEVAGIAERIRRHVAAAIAEQQGAFESLTAEAQGEIDRLSGSVRNTIEGALTEQVGALEERLGAADERARSMADTIKTIVVEALDGELGRIDGAAEQASARIRAIAEQVSAAVEDSLSGHVAQIEAAAGKVGGDIQAVGDTLKGAAEDMTGSIRATSEQAAAAADRFRSQVEALSTATREAATQTDEVREAVLDGRRQAFLLASSAIIRELNELAIDIDKVVESGIPDEAMEQYNAGDFGVFVRRIVRKRDAYAVPLVRERMRKDPGFERNVRTYVSRFERLLAATADCDPDKLLTSTFLTADIGKVYMLLNRANQPDKVEQFAK